MEKNRLYNILHTIINYFENISTVITFGMITVEVWYLHEFWDTTYKYTMINGAIDS